MLGKVKTIGVWKGNLEKKKKKTWGSKRVNVSSPCCHWVLQWFHTGMMMSQ